jgi:phosphoribosylanthranilate isomerase
MAPSISTFSIKICGIANQDDAQAAFRAGADAIGLNFYAQSPRYIDFDRANRIVPALPAGLATVGLFVNSDPTIICDAHDKLALKWIQLHGDEPPEFLIELGKRAIIKAFRFGPEGWKPIIEYLQRCRDLNCLPAMMLVDALAPGQYGGTGRRVSWKLLKGYPFESWQPPLVLAGGLTPENVAEAVAMVRPAAVDTASGVESAPGVKDHNKIAAFATAAKKQLAL